MGTDEYISPVPIHRCSDRNALQETCIYQRGRRGLYGGDWRRNLYGSSRLDRLHGWVSQASLDGGRNRP